MQAPEESLAETVDPEARVGAISGSDNVILSTSHRL